MSKRTVIIGATPNPEKYAWIAADFLQSAGHPFIPLGISKGEVLGHEIVDLSGKPAISDVDTVTLYIGPHRQPEYYQYILSLKPRRIIFNPGTENLEFQQLARQAGIEPVVACTLVMLRTGQY
ncbi:MAG: CoA-binding protein [Cyclobacteriaceae bacterium]|nr:CoA-binding protein [Cyclobacteriaceae bacterium]